MNSEENKDQREGESAASASHCYAIVSLPLEVQANEGDQPVGLVIQAVKHVLAGDDPDGFKSHILFFASRKDAEAWYEANNDHLLKQRHVSCFPIIAGPSA